MFKVDSPHGVNAEPRDGGICLMFGDTSAWMSAEAALRTAERLILAAEAAMNARGQLNDNREPAP